MAAKAREETARVTTKYKFFSEVEVICESKNSKVKIRFWFERKISEYGK